MTIEQATRAIEASATIIKLETALYDVLGSTTLAKAKVIADQALPIERVLEEQTHE